MDAVAYRPSSDRIRKALDDYGGEGPDSYQTINDGLRGGNTYGTHSFTERQQGNVDSLDAAMRESTGAPQELLVYRQVRGPDAFGGTNDDWFGSSPPSLTGLTWRDKGFVSTGAGEEWTQSDSVTMHIRVPAGTKALSYTRRGTGMDGGLDSDEILLDRGLSFRVTADRGYRRSKADGSPDPFSGRDIEVEIVSSL